MKIYKYPVSAAAEWVVNKVKLPQGARLLKFGADAAGVPCIWAIVNEDYPLETIDVYTFWTGADFPTSVELEFFGTAEVIGGLIVHAFTLKKEEENVKEETDRAEA